MCRSHRELMPIEIWLLHGLRCLPITGRGQPNKMAVVWVTKMVTLISGSHDGSNKDNEAHVAAWDLQCQSVPQTPPHTDFTCYWHCLLSPILPSFYLPRVLPGEHESSKAVGSNACTVMVAVEALTCFLFEYKIIIWRLIPSSGLKVGMWKWYEGQLHCLQGALPGDRITFWRTNKKPSQLLSGLNVQAHCWETRNTSLADAMGSFPSWALVNIDPYSSTAAWCLLLFHCILAALIFSLLSHHMQTFPWEYGYSHPGKKTFPWMWDP